MIDKIKNCIKKYKEYIISIAIALLVGIMSTLLTRKNMNMFDNIKQPPLTPPKAVFPIVWTILFILMGISAAMVYKKKSEKETEVRNALVIYGVSLLFNFLWSIIFFNMQTFLFAFIWLIALWVLVAVTIIEYMKINRCAAYLQIPYLVWVTFAGYINLGVFLLNR